MVDENHDYSRYFEPLPAKPVPAPNDVSEGGAPSITEQDSVGENNDEHLRKIKDAADLLAKQLLDRVWDVSIRLVDAYSEEWSAINKEAYATRQRTGRYGNKPGRMWIGVKVPKDRDTVYLYWYRYTGTKVRISPKEYIKNKKYIKNTGPNRNKYPMTVLRANCEPWEYPIVSRYENKLAVLREMRDKIVRIKSDYYRMIEKLETILESEDVLPNE